MKTLLTTAIVSFAAFVNAASVNWGTGAVAVTFGGETLSSGVTGYLVSLGTTEDPTKVWVLDVTEGTLSGATSKSDASPVTFPPVVAGRIAGTYNDGGDGTIANGSVFGMYISYIDSAGTKWFNFASQTATTTADASGRFPDIEYTFNFETKKEINVKNGEAPTAGGGWYSAVPEPSTAMLALAGLALLIKRRRA